MAAYAALASLMNTVDQIQNHPCPTISLYKKQVENLGEKLCFLEEFIEKYSHIGGSTEIEALKRLIASAAHAAEDAIESDIMDQIHAGSICLLDTQPIIECMHSLKEKVMKVEAERGLQDIRPTFSTSSTSSTPLPTTEKSKMVGCDDELMQLMDVLAGQQSSRQIISIHGMGGIGKTTLVKNAYEDSVIVQHFDIRAWATLSQDYNVKNILLQLLSCQGKSTREMDRESEDQLREELHKSLFGRRYLIILDDMWSVDVWDEIKNLFPENGIRSRIVVTTRESRVALHFGSLSLEKRFLDDDNCWDLFCEKVFAQEDCPLELEEIGKMIVKKCKRLPLSVVVIGGLLRSSPRTLENWKNVEKILTQFLFQGRMSIASKYYRLVIVTYLSI